MAMMLQLGGTAGALLIGASDGHRYNPHTVLGSFYALAALFIALIGSATASPWLLSLAVFGQHFHDLAGDLACLLDALDIPKAYIVGSSLGGMTAQALALANPDTLLSLTLMAIAAYLPPAEAWGTAGKNSLPEGMAAIIDAVFPRSFTPTSTEASPERWLPSAIGSWRSTLAVVRSAAGLSATGSAAGYRVDHDAYPHHCGCGRSGDAGRHDGGHPGAHRRFRTGGPAARGSPSCTNVLHL